MNSRKASLAELPIILKYPRYEDISTEKRDNYFHISYQPITKNAENDLEIISDLITWGEQFRYHFKMGFFKCSRCSNYLYSSDDKWNGPCVWPSFRKSYNKELLFAIEVAPYNNYQVTVKELYCSKVDSSEVDLCSIYRSRAGLKYAFKNR